MTRPTRALVACLLVLPLGLSAVPPAAAADPSYDDGGAVLNILPPGSRGNVTALQAAQLGPSRLATPTSPPQFADELERYDALPRTRPGQLGEGDLTDYFKNAPIDLADADAVSTVEPRPGTVVRRDRFGVPYVTGVTAEDVAFGAGYAGTQDRMFLTDLLRHVGAARTTEFLGSSAANVAMDVGQLRVAAYTRDEAEAQIEKTLKRFPTEAPALLARLDAFIAGINKAQEELCPGAFGLPIGAVTGGEAAVGVGLGPNCPVEYQALDTPPTPYERADIVYIASLVGGIFGKGGGGEAANDRWLQQLTAKYGAAAAVRVFEDFRSRNDPEAPTSATVRFPYEGEVVDPTAPGAARLDLTGDTAPGTGSDAGGSTLPVPLPVPAESASFGVLDGPFGKLDLGLRPRGTSNALLVGASESATGKPLAVFGPQTGYFTPQLLTEISMRGPGIAARGVSFTGTQLVVQLGHGVDYAWSATSASSDNVDTVVERLCNVDGSPPSVESEAYLVDGACTPFDAFVHTQTALPSAAGMEPPRVVNLQVFRTRHGIVQGRRTAGGQPVAVVSQRSTYTQELDSAVGFARINDPDYVDSAADFQRAFGGVDYTFNWFYADDRDIAYFGSGLLPVRAAGVSPDLPRWGDRTFDWQGFVPFAAHAQQVNPSQGYFVSWNNKQAPGFSAADNQYGYGPVYRSQLLESRIRSRIAGPTKITRVGLVDAMSDAATADLRGEVLLPLLLDVVGPDPANAEAVALLRAWAAAGAPRVDRDRDGSYDDHSAAIALFDEWWESSPVQGGPGRGGRGRVADDVLRPELGELVDELPGNNDDHPRIGVGSAWNGVGAYGYVSKELRRVLGRPVVAPYSRSYCGTLAGCRGVLRASLSAAVDRALAAQSVATVGALTYAKAQDNIRPTTGGLVGTRQIDWQNRPTFQQVVAFTTHRPRGVAAPGGAAAPRPAPGGSGRPGGGSLAATGVDAALPAAAVALLAVALVGLARRRRA